MKSLRIKIAVFALSVIYAGLLWLVPPMFNHPVSVSVELKTPNDEVCQVFYATPDHGFSENQVASIRYASGKDFVKIVIPVNKREKINTLRIDPVINSGEFQIKSITLTIGSVGKCFTGEEIVENFELINLDFNGISDGVVNLKEKNSPDAQMILKPALTEIFVLKYPTAKAVFIGISVVFYLILLALMIQFGERIYSTIHRWMKLFHSEVSMALNIESIKNFVVKNKTIIVVSILVAIFSNGYELFNFSLSMDEEICTFSRSADLKLLIILGRWALYYIHIFLEPVSLVPYFPTILTILLLAVTSVLIISKEHQEFGSYVIFIFIFLSSPTHSYYIAYNNLSTAMAIGMLFTSLSYLLFLKSQQQQKPVFILYVFSIFLIAFSIAVYQSLIAFFFVLGAYYLFSIQKAEKPMRNTWLAAGRLLIISIFAVVVYKISDVFFRHLLLAPDFVNNQDYLNNHIGWGTQPVRLVLKNINNSITFFYSHHEHFGLSNASLFFLFPVLLYFILTEKIRGTQKIFKTILLILFIVSPFAIIILNGHFLPMRSMVALPLMLGLLWMMVYQKLGGIMKKVILIAAIAILINNTFINTRLFYSSYVTWQADRNMANRIIERIYNLEPPIKAGRIPVAFIGKYNHPQNQLFFSSEVFGASFFGWDNGNPHRMRLLFKTLGVNEIEDMPMDKLKKIEKSIDSLPCWPLKGSVSLMDSVVVVKFSNPSNHK